jgi:hypothetical protein
MAHFARLNDNNIVEDIHVVANYVIEINGIESEQAGINFLKQIHGDFIWKQTSYNATLRKNFASIGSQYDLMRDAFISPKPYSSWVLDEDTCLWKAPIAYPTDDKRYDWSETNQQWIEVAE